MVEIIKQPNGVWWIEHPIRKGRFSSLLTTDEEVAKAKKALVEKMARALEKKKTKRLMSDEDWV